MREGHATIQSRNGSTVPLTLFGLTKTFTCVQLSNTYLSATLTTATFPTAAACRGFDASACTPRDLLSSHWQLRLHLMEGRQPFIYRCAPRGTRTGQCPAEKPRLARSLRKMGRTLTCPLSQGCIIMGNAPSLSSVRYHLNFHSSNVILFPFRIKQRSIVPVIFV